MHFSTLSIYDSVSLSRSTLRITKDSLKAESFGNDTKCDEKREINGRTTIMHSMERDPHSDADVMKKVLQEPEGYATKTLNREKL